MRFVSVMMMIVGIGVAGAGWVRGEDVPPKEMPPEILTKVTDVMKKIAVIKREQWDGLVRDEIAATVKETGLDAEGTRGLEAAAAKAEDAAMDDYTAACIRKFGEVYAKGNAHSLDWVVKPGVPQGAAGPEGPTGSGVSFTGPLDQPAWKDGVARILSPAQAAALEKVRAERRKAIADYLDRQTDLTRQALEPSILAQSGEMIAALNLPPERAETLKALAKQATDASVEVWRQSATSSLLAQNEAWRTQRLKNNTFHYGFNAKDAPEKQAVWTDGLAKLLTDEERARLQTVRDGHKTRRAHALGQLTVALMDEKAAFTGSQRQRLEPVMEKLVLSQPELFPGAGNDNNYFSAQSLYKVAFAAKSEDLRPILDDLQWGRWQAAAHDRNLGNDDAEETSPPAAPTPANQEASAGEPEDMEQTVSDFLQAKAVAHYKQVESAMILQAEDATRVAGLDTPHAARLQTAARGASEAELVTWLSSMEQNTRAEVQNATPENIRQKLNGGSRYGYDRTEPQGNPLWKATVKAEMTTPQQDAWKTECDSRSRYNDAAVAGFLLAEFDRRYSLQPGQWDQLAPVVSKALEEYQPDIRRMFSYSSGPWYMMSYYMFLPLQAVPENDLKAMLGKEQWDRWTGSSEYNYSAHYWNNIRQMHTRNTSGKSQ